MFVHTSQKNLYVRSTCNDPRNYHKLRCSRDTTRDFLEIVRIPLCPEDKWRGSFQNRSSIKHGKENRRNGDIFHPRPLIFQTIRLPIKSLIAKWTRTRNSVFISPWRDTPLPSLLGRKYRRRSRSCPTEINLDSGEISSRELRGKNSMISEQLRSKLCER